MTILVTVVLVRVSHDTNISTVRKTARFIVVASTQQP